MTAVKLIQAVDLTNNGRKGSLNRRTGVRALIQAADENGPYRVVLYRTINRRIDESCPEVLVGFWDDLGEASNAARRALLDHRPGRSGTEKNGSK